MAFEAVDTRARGLRPPRARARSAACSPSCAGSTGCSSRAMVALVGFGLWAIDGITRHDGRRRARPPGAIRRGRQRRLRRHDADRPGGLPPLQPAIFVSDVRADGVRLVAGAATRGSRRWIDLGFFRFQPSEFGKVLFTLFLAAFLADRVEADHRAADAARRRSRSRPARSCSSSCSRTSAPRSSTRPCSPRCCSSPACAGCTSRRSARSR